MADYINTERAVKEVREIIFDLESLIDTFICDYDKDVQEVRHGKWENDKVAFFFTCSECGANVRQNMDEVFCGEGQLNYCPNCGARMDK